MELIQEYLRQQSWRNWEKYLPRLPIQKSDRILDLGCSVGGFLRAAAPYCAESIGVDMNPDFIAYCQRHQTASQTFVCDDIESLDLKQLPTINGIWCSYALTYLSDPAAYLARLCEALAPGSWIGLLDINCFISGNLPEDSPFYEAVRRFELESQGSGVYDFALGHKLPDYLTNAGFSLLHLDNNMTDLELNFEGPAGPDVRQNWAARLERMPRLRQKLGAAYPAMCKSLLNFLSSPAHTRRQNVWFAVGAKPGA